jgi:hypothetical protein
MRRSKLLDEKLLHRESDALSEDHNRVHEEIRVLGSNAKHLIEEKLSRHATSEQQVLVGMRRFGPSAQSRAMLSRELEGAEHAMETGQYVVWRNVNLTACSKSSSKGLSADFCCRVGPDHRCFCSHNLADHQAKVARNEALGKRPSLKSSPGSHRCSKCSCNRFQYVPNEPEEVGEHWLSRRAGYVVGSWSPKCKMCSHTSAEHDSVTKQCSKCKVCHLSGGFVASCRCIVCDGKLQDHETIFETERDRLEQHLPTGQQFFPLSKKSDEELRELVFGQVPSLNQRKEVSHCASLVAPSSVILSCSCVKCGMQLKSPSSNFCHICGAPRLRPN